MIPSIPEAENINFTIVALSDVNVERKHTHNGLKTQFSTY